MLATLRRREADLGERAQPGRVEPSERLGSPQRAHRSMHPWADVVSWACLRSERAGGSMVSALASPAEGLAAFRPGNGRVAMTCRVLAASRQADSVDSKVGAVENGEQSFRAPRELAGKPLWTNWACCAGPDQFGPCRGGRSVRYVRFGPDRRRPQSCCDGPRSVTA